MKQRIFTALCLLPLVVIAIFKLPWFMFVMFLSAIIMFAFFEWHRFLRRKFNPLQLIILALIFSGCNITGIFLNNIFLNKQISIHYVILAIGVIWWLIASALVITYPNSSKFLCFSSALHHVFGICTLLPFFWSVLLLRAVESNTYSSYGARLVLFVFLIVWSVDIGAYFFGKIIGKSKMAPLVSPNKTIEGLIGGVVTSLMVSYFFSQFFCIKFSSSISMAVIIFFTIVVSVMGDLVESMFKRVSGIKDSGSIIPGHGGILDRIDSLAAAFPVFAFLYLIF
ncbi:phosphatidate cytidylyltransferase [Candidatus Photodesmus anomalopis]|uniref:Phosphatidate cytidylyltransferase n=1 Tax=Candidatus Photodesmus katoptron Akat1 TaxID=1236703 RepID=S3DJN7_9GAMM|nr:phosphatidate cytidylyltransferase [Candidatus Photodesmus katoptron]EPE37925.1 phosphatidate cytidylyltransferase [Candidatus Photodesmus katoptron Akat1]